VDYSLDPDWTVSDKNTLEQKCRLTIELITIHAAIFLLELLKENTEARTMTGNVYST